LIASATATGDINGKIIKTKNVALLLFTITLSIKYSDTLHSINNLHQKKEKKSSKFFVIKVKI